MKSARTFTGLSIQLMTVIDTDGADGRNIVQPSPD